MQPNKALGTLLVLLGVSALIYLFANNGNTSFGNLFSGFTKSVHEERTFDAGEISSFDIESNSLDVDIVRTSGDDIVVTLDGRATKSIANNLQLESNVDGDTLKLSLQSNQKFHIGFNWSSVKLIVALPDRTWNHINTKLNSGDIEMHSADFITGELRTNSGDIEVKASSASELLQIKANSGDLELSNIKAHTISLETNSGDIALERYEAERLEFDVKSGEVKLEDGFAEIQGETGSGDIRLKADNMTRNVTLKAGSGDVNISLAQDPESLDVQFHTGSGDAVVRKSGFEKEGKNGERDVNGKFGSGELKLNVRTGSGDIILH